MALFYQALLYENIQNTWESAHCQSIVKEIMDAFTGGSAKMSRFTYFPRHKMSAARRLKLFCTPAWTAKNHFVGTGLSFQSSLTPPPGRNFSCLCFLTSSLTCWYPGFRPKVHSQHFEGHHDSPISCEE